MAADDYGVAWRELWIAIYLDALAQWKWPLLWPPERELARRDAMNQPQKKDRP